MKIASVITSPLLLRPYLSTQVSELAGSTSQSSSEPLPKYDFFVTCDAKDKDAIAKVFQQLKTESDYFHILSHNLNEATDKDTRNCFKKKRLL